jgi:hypothetical protein
MLSIILFLCWITGWINAKYYTKIIKTPLYESCKHIRLHDVVLLRNRPFHTNHLLYEDVYIFEFVPIANISKINVLVTMFLGNNIPGKIRKYYFSQISHIDIINSKYTSDNELQSCSDVKVQDKLNNWNCQFNVYFHNCRHFSKYFKKIS